MDKRMKGELLCLLGLPAGIAGYGIIGAFHGGSSANPLHLLWAGPLMLVSLPVLPALLKGERLLRECDQEEFTIMNRDLPHVLLPDEYRWLDIAEDGITYIGPEYDEYSDEANARSWLINNGYREVVALDFPTSLDTKWVKQEYIDDSQRSRQDSP